MIYKLPGVGNKLYPRAHHLGFFKEDFKMSVKSKAKNHVIFVVWGRQSEDVCKYEFANKTQLTNFMDGAYEAIHKIYGTPDDEMSGWEHIFTFNTRREANRFVNEGIYE
jgi:hypothetical protein